MSHFAKVENGIVTDITVAEQDFIDSGALGDPSLWIQTSYNTRGGIHYGQNGGPDGGIALRYNYAQINGAYDKEADAFYDLPQPFPSWSLDTTTYLWTSPIPIPNDDGIGNPPKFYNWNEETLTWDLVPNV